MKEGIRMKQKREIRTVSLIGLGAIGCFLASHLGHLLGSDLRVIAGGSRRERLEREGVIVNGVRHHFNIVSPEENCGQNYPDLAIIITKFPALPQALEDMRNQIGPDTLIMAPLNGVEAEDKVAEVFGWDNLLYSLAKVSVVMKDGCASFNPKAARIEMGEKHNETMSPRVQAVKEMFERDGIEALRMLLKRLDPVSYITVDLKNAKRIMHALEVCLMTGKPYSSFLTGSVKDREFDIVKIGLNREREELFDRINRRVDQMVEAGMEGEARRLYPLRHLNALNTVGYKEWFDYFDGKFDREEAIRLIKRNTRRYAKKQLTWYRNDADIHWFHPDQKDEIKSFL